MRVEYTWPDGRTVYDNVSLLAEDVAAAKHVVSEIAQARIAAWAESSARFAGASFVIHDPPPPEGR